MKKLMLFMFIFILLAGTVSALDIDNRKYYDEDTKTITIENTFGLGRVLAEYTLTYNTNQCLENCYATGTLYLDDDNQPLFDDIEFRNKVGDTKQINEYKYFIKVEDKIDYQVPIYEKVCEYIIENGTEYCYMKDTGETKEIEEVSYEWKRYTGEILERGNYEWRIEGRKDMYESVDWIVSTMGKDLTEWAWWNSNWNKKVKINISENSGGTLTDYQVKLNVVYDSDMNNDFSDLRFLNGSENTELNYWIENQVNGSYADVWVKIPSLSASSNTSIYMYYKNPTANSESDAQATMTLYDSFDDSSLNTTLWDTTGSGSFFEGTDFINITGTDFNSDLTALSSDNGFGLSHRYKARLFHAVGYTYAGFYDNLNFAVRDTVDSEEMRALGAGGGDLAISRYSGSLTSTGSQNWGATSWHTFEIKRVNSTYTKFNYNDGTTIITHTTNINLGNLEIAHGGQGTHKITLDWVYVTKYVEPEPTSSFGNETDRTTINVTLDSPENLAKIVNATVIFNGTVISGFSVINVSLYIDGIINETNTSGINNSLYEFTTTLGQGQHNWTIEACNNIGQCGDGETRNFEVHLTPPEILIFYPKGIVNSLILGENLTLNWSVTELGVNLSEHIKNCSYTYNESIVYLNLTTCIETNQTTFQYIEGIDNISMTIIDEFNFSTLNTSSWNINFLETGFEFEEIVLETSTQEFKLNITVNNGLSVQSADLIYNDKTFANADKGQISSTEFELIQTISIPGGIVGFIEENRSFYWNVTISNISTGSTFSIQSGTRNQTVLELRFGLCHGDLSTAVLNFTMFDELTGTQINAANNATDFQATFLYGVSADNLVKNVSFDILNNDSSEFDFCVQNTTGTIYATMALSYSAEGYSDRNYVLTQAPLTNITNEITLYLLESGESIEFFVSVERELFPLPDVTVTVSKFFVGEGVFKTVMIEQTDGIGKFVAFLELNKDFQFVVTNGSEVLGTINKRSICEGAPCELTLSIPAASSNLLAGLEAAFAENILYNLSYNGSSKVVNFVFIDTTGLATYFNMVVYKVVTNQTSSVISNQTVYASSGSMSYNASAYSSGDFRVETYISRSPDQFIDFLTFIISDVTVQLGLLGLFVAFLIILVVIFGVAFSPSMLIFAIPLSLTITKLMGIISLSNGAITMFYVLAVVAFAALSQR